MALPIIGMGQDTSSVHYTKSPGYGPSNPIDIKTIQYIRQSEWYKQFRELNFNDTIPVTIDYQYTRRDVPMTIDCYLINGVPYKKSCAPLTRGKFVRVMCSRWRISNGWVNQNK